MAERPNHRQKMFAQEWIKAQEEIVERSLIPGNPNKTAELLKSIRENPVRRGRPPKVKQELQS